MGIIDFIRIFQRKMLAIEMTGTPLQMNTAYVAGLMDGLTGQDHTKDWQ